MDHRITQCPRCGTSFRVTEAHLAVAAGAVRCGSCLHIFNAREHWILPPAPPPPEPEPPREEPELDDLIIDDDALFDDNTPLFADDEPEPVAFDATDSVHNEEAAAADFPDNVVAFPRPNRLMGHEQTKSPEHVFGVAPELTRDSLDDGAGVFAELEGWEQEIGSGASRVEELDEELSASDEEWTRDLLRDEESLFATAAEPAATAATLADYGLADPGAGGARVEPVFGDAEPLDDATLLFADTEPADERQPEPDDEIAATGEPLAAPAESGSSTDDQPPATDHPTSSIEDLAPAFAAIEEEPELAPEFLDLHSAPREQAAGPAAATIAYATEPQPAGERNDEPDTIVTDASYGPDLYAERRPTPAAADRDDDPLASLDRLGAEPLQIHQLRRERRWPQVLWSLGLIASLALLGWQYVHANFDELARGPARPWLARACEMAGCTLPSRSDIAQISSGNLIVRSHPTRPGALAVDAIITNLAAFPQPYPELLLQFTDLNGTPVAGRRFRASEYLAGELSGASLMPVRQPVHIALELVDPGPQAVNYALTVVAPAGAP